MSETSATPRNGKEQGLSIEEVIEAALETKPLTPEEKKALEEEYRRRERGKPGRKQGRRECP